MRYLNFTEPASFCSSKPPLTYKIANATYLSNKYIPELSHLLVSQTTLAVLAPSLHEHCPYLVYSDACMIGDNKYKLSVYSNNNGCYLLKSNQYNYLINKNQIFSTTNTFDLTLFTGPVLILNLALNKIFCLHASAFILKDKTFILMADSGTGKSTVAHFIDQHNLGTRLSDDIVPIGIHNGKTTVLPDFPQLKLSNNQQYNGNPIQNPIILLFATKSLRSTKIQEINDFITVKKLIQHSVATKLFAANELQNHLDFCFQVSQNSQAFQVDYSHTENSLSKLVQALNAIL